MNTPAQVAYHCRNMLPGQALFLTPTDKEDLSRITKISYSKHFEYSVWSFINAKGETAIVSGPLFAKEVFNRLMMSCCSICAEEVELYNPLMGEEAQNALQEALDSYDEHEGYTECQVIGYFRNENGSYTAFDNTTADCWVEEFDSEMQSVAYLLSDYNSAEELIQRLHR